MALSMLHEHHMATFSRCHLRQNDRVQTDHIKRLVASLHPSQAEGDGKIDSEQHGTREDSQTILLRTRNKTRILAAAPEREMFWSTSCTASVQLRTSTAELPLGNCRGLVSYYCTASVQLARIHFGHLREKEEGGRTMIFRFAKGRSTSKVSM